MIDLLQQLPPGSAGHTKLVNKIVEKFEASSNAISKFDRRWGYNENAYFAYIDRDSKSKAAKQANDEGKSPEVIDVVIPHVFSTVQTIVTYLLHVFCGAEVCFTLKGYNDIEEKRARYIEKALQIELEENKFADKFRQFFLDGQIYGFGVMRTDWFKDLRKQTIQNEDGTTSTIFVPYREFTRLDNIDPYNFYPDPRVPIRDCAEKGEFVFWTAREQKFMLMREQQNKKLLYVDQIEDGSVDFSDRQGDSRSKRRRELNPTDQSSVSDKQLKDLVYLIQGTVELNPEEFGLKGDNLVSQKYKVTIANKKTLIQFEPYDAFHNQHPIVVNEPHCSGYEFVSHGMVDMLTDFQSIMSWMYNSRIQNTRFAISGNLVYNPQYVEEDDIRNSTPGSGYRLKPGAAGDKTKEYIHQIVTPDVTSNHIKDMEVSAIIADRVSGATDNLRGEETQKEQTATEVNTKSSNAAQRLQALARVISSQAFGTLARQMIMNIQQYRSLPLRIDDQDLPPQKFSGNYRFIAHDGTLPQARQQELAVFKEVFQTVLQVPDFNVMYKPELIFETIASKAGVNLAAYRRSPEEVEQQKQAMANQPDPEAQKIQAEQQAEMQRMQAEFAMKKMEMQLEQQREQQKHELEMAKIQAELEAKQQELQIQAQKNQMDLQQQQNKNALDFQAAQQQAAIQKQQGEQQVEINRENADIQQQAAQQKQAQSETK